MELSESVLVAIISGAGTLLGSLLGVIASSKLTQYRIKKLEEKVDKHNSVVERTFIVEGDIREIKHDIRDLKAFHPPKVN